EPCLAGKAARERTRERGELQGGLEQRDEIEEAPGEVEVRVGVAAGAGRLDAESPSLRGRRERGQQDEFRARRARRLERRDDVRQAGSGGHEDRDGAARLAPAADRGE